MSNGCNEHPFNLVFTEPIFFGQRLSENKKFKELKDSFDIFHDNQSISQYPRFMHEKLVTTLHHREY